MSFSMEVKQEICNLNYKKEEGIALLTAFIKNNKVNNNDNNTLMTENAKIARKIYSMLKECFDVNPTIIEKRSTSFNKKYFYNIVIPNKIKLMLKKDIIANEENKRSYLRGSFLAKGSINDPKTSRYHLEYLIDDMKEAKFVSKILNEFSITNKIIDRDIGYMVYVKEAEKIADFLRVISANMAVLYYEDIRIYRDHKNMTNRLNNCEQANVDKIIQSASKELNDISYLENTIGFDLLDEKLKEVIIYRKKYPDVSLNDLSYIISSETGNSITKSGLSHRFRKISEMCKKISEEKKS